MPMDSPVDHAANRKDPMQVTYTKLRKSTKAVLERAAAKRGRFSAFLIREILEDWAEKYRRREEEEAAKAKAAAKRGKVA